MDLCIREVRMKTEEHFAYEGVPRGIDESLALCERELEERIRFLRSVIGVSAHGGDLGVAADQGVRAGDLRRWKQAVNDAVEARIRRRNLSAEQDRERRRLDGFVVEGNERREGDKDGRSGTIEMKMCFGCGLRGHIKKNCKEKKDNGPHGRIL